VGLLLDLRQQLASTQVEIPVKPCQTGALDLPWRNLVSFLCQGGDFA
jgi:hypothetical protein